MSNMRFRYECINTYGIRSNFVSSALLEEGISIIDDNNISAIIISVEVISDIYGAGDLHNDYEIAKIFH